MGFLKEYRICMPLTVEEYQIGQLYMIAKHSHEQSNSGEGVEVVVNIQCEHEVYGKGQYTEKRIHLSNKLPYWIQSVIPRVFYIIEKAWNYYPFTITEYSCSFLPKLSIKIQTNYENNNGSNENCLNMSPEELEQRTVEFLDICYDEINLKYYKEDEDLRFFQSQKTKRGPLAEGWRETTQPIMCTYKVVQGSFEVWGLQTKVEELIEKTIREILIVGHRQAVAWMDEWYDMSLTEVRLYENDMHRQTNTKVNEELPSVPTTPVTPPNNKSSWLPWQ